MIDSLNEKILEIAKPFFEEIGAELVDLNVRRTHSQVHIQILADKPAGGITIDECSELNRKIGDAIEGQSLIGVHYLLEVSSPGLDRPLKTFRDFLRVRGREVRFFLSEPVEEKLEHAGVVQRIEGDQVVIESNFSKIVIPLNKINKAKQVIL